VYRRHARATIVCAKQREGPTPRYRRLHMTVWQTNGLVTNNISCCFIGLEVPTCTDQSDEVCCLLPSQRHESRIHTLQLSKRMGNLVTFVHSLDWDVLVYSRKKGAD